MVALDTSLTDDLILEGIAREIVRTVQDARKSAGLEISDRIHLGISGTGLVEKARETYRDYIMSETLAADLVSAGQVEGVSSNKTLEDQSWVICLQRVVTDES